MNRSVIFALAVYALSLLSLQHSVAAGEYPAAHVTSSGQYKVIFENGQVLVLKMVLKPGEADILHSHNNETVYFEQGGQLTISLPTGESIVADVPNGHVMWHEAWSHQVTNTGDTQVIAVIVEEK